MTGCATEVQQAAFSEHNDRVTVGELPFVDLRLDVDALDTRGSGKPGHVDFVVEVADVANNRVVLHS